MCPRALIEEVLADTGKASQPERLLPAPAVVYYVMVPALWCKAPPKEVLRVVCEGLRCVCQSPELSLETRITEAGVISYPLLGSINLAGLTVAEAEQRIANGLRDGNFVKQPQMLINVVQARGKQVSVIGQVSRPGRYPLETGEVRLTPGTPWTRRSRWLSA